MQKSNFYEMIAAGERILKALKEITDCLAIIIEAAKSIEDVLTGSGAIEVQAEVTEEDSGPSYTKEAVRGILASRSAAGFGTEVKKILAAHGAEKLSELSEAEYAAVIAEAEVLSND